MCFAFTKGKQIPYKILDDLPESVKKVLPKHAQEIYFEAFNYAWEEYKDPQKRKTPGSQEEIAHKVAWAVVKKTYVKQGHKWIKGLETLLK